MTYVTFWVWHGKVKSWEPVSEEVRLQATVEDKSDNEVTSYETDSESDESRHIFKPYT